MSLDLEPLEDRVAPTTLAAGAGMPTFINPAESEILAAQLQARMGPRQDTAPLFPAPLPHASPSRNALVSEGEAREEEELATAGELALVPTEAVSNEVMAELGTPIAPIEFGADSTE